MQLSEEVVYEILNGILEVEGNTFKRLQVPKAWCKGGEKNSPSKRLTQFINSHELAFMNGKNLCVYFGYDDLQSLMQQFEIDQQNGTRSDDIDRCIKCNYYQDFARCTHCNELVCFGCDDLNMCSGDDCNIISCDGCQYYGEQPDNLVSWCGGENYECESRCEDCRFRDCCNGVIDCADCKARVFNRLLEQFNEKKVENDQLRQELSQLH